MDDNHQLMFDTLEEATKYIPKLIKGIEQSISYFRAGKNNEALNLLNDILDGIEWVNDAINLTMPFWDNNASVDPMALQEPLRTMSQALENCDYTLACDIMDYEIKPVLIQWLNDIKLGLRR